MTEDRLRFLNTTMRHQPAWRFRQPEAHEKDHEPEARTDQKSEAPAQFRWEHCGVEQQNRAGCTDCRPDPKTSIDDEIGPTAVTGGDEFLDGRIDGGIFPADASAGEETEQGEAPQVPRERSRSGGDEVNRKRHEEKPFASEPISEPAEEHCTE